MYFKVLRGKEKINLDDYAESWEKTMRIDKKYFLGIEMFSIPELSRTL